MKFLLKFTVIITFFVLTSCGKEQLQNAIYSPNGLLVSESMEQLSTQIAQSLDFKENDLSIQAVKFLNIEEGFAAEIEAIRISTDDNIKLYYMSENYYGKIDLKGDIRVGTHSTKRVRQAIAGYTVWCSCGGDSSASSNCIAQLNLGTGVASCIPSGCAWGCYLHAG